jgi:RNA ligase
VRHPLRGALFLRLDGKDYRPGLRQQARPAGELTPQETKVTEE